MSLKYVHTNTVCEHHGKPIFCVTFNTYDAANADLVASVGGQQATVYRCHPKGRMEVLQVYVDDRDKSSTSDQAPEQESWYCCKWTVDRATRQPLLLLAGRLAIIRVVNCCTRRALKSLRGHGKEINDISVHPHHPHLIVSASKDTSIRLWNVETGCCVLLMRGPGAHTGEVFTLDFHPWDRDLFVSGGMEGAVKVWSLKEHWASVVRSEAWSVPPSRRAFPVTLVGHPHFSSRQVHSDYVDCCRWLGDLVLSKSTDYKIKLWRPHYPSAPLMETSGTFEVLQVFDMPGDLMWWVRFSLDPFGRVLACGNTQGTTYLWRPGAPKPQRGATLKHRNCRGVIRQTAVSLDGAIVISSTEDARLWRWDQRPATAGKKQAAAGRAKGHAGGGGRQQQQDGRDSGDGGGSDGGGPDGSGGGSGGGAPPSDPMDVDA